MTEAPAKPFAHLDAPNADLYRAVMGVFVAAKRRFLVHLRPEDVLEALRGPEGPPVEAAAVEAALKQLESWRNLQADPDTSRVTTVTTSTGLVTSTSSPRKVRPRSWRWPPIPRRWEPGASCSRWRSRTSGCASAACGGRPKTPTRTRPWCTACCGSCPRCWTGWRPTRARS